MIFQKQDEPLNCKEIVRAGIPKRQLWGENEVPEFEFTKIMSKFVTHFMVQQEQFRQVISCDRPGEAIGYSSKTVQKTYFS